MAQVEEDRRVVVTRRRQTAISRGIEETFEVLPH